MKVLWLSHLIPFPPKGGVLQRAFHLLRQTALRHEVHLVAFIQRDLMRTHFATLASGIAECQAGLDFCASTVFVDIPVDTARLGKPALAASCLLTGHTYTLDWLRSRTFAARVQDTLSTCGPFDLVHFDTISLVPYRSFMPRLPMTLDHHNVESQMMLRRAAKERSLLKKAYFFQEGWKLQRYEARVCAEFASNLMCSELDAERLRTVCPRAAIAVIPNGVDLSYFRPSETAPNFRKCIFAGRLNAYTNLESARFIVSQLWPLLRDRSPDISFDLVGPNPPAEALSLAAADARFRVTGYVDDVRPHLDAAGIFVCPMFDGGGTKLKILDAMAMQKAIVATPLAVEGIDVQDGVHALLASSREDFVDAIGRLAADPELAMRIARAARQKVSDEYSYDTVGVQLARVFERALQTAGGR